MKTQFVTKSYQKKLLAWFEENKRDLPWRHYQDPYSIWISEVMLQQTTCQVVIPYYKKFIKKFPNLKSLAQAKISDVFSLWSGLGYYQRARNLVKASQVLFHKKEFPKTYKELIQIVGFGPYTSRAVSSFAFKEEVGVLDGNVIRFLCRFHNLSIKWWQVKERDKLQTYSDLWVQGFDSSKMNQALMELGSLVCVKEKPFCALCPLAKNCKALQKGSLKKLPLKKDPVPFSLIYYEPVILKRKSDFLFIQNPKSPFLKKRWIFPGALKQVKRIPKNFDFVHSITKYKIYTKVRFADDLAIFKNSKLKRSSTKRITFEISEEEILELLDKDLKKFQKKKSLSREEKRNVKDISKKVVGRGDLSKKRLSKKRLSKKSLSHHFIFLNQKEIKEKNPSSLITKILKQIK